MHRFNVLTRRVGVGFVCAVLSVSLFGGNPTATGNPTVTGEPLRVSSDPFAEARATGEPVELVGERTETGTFFANPDGTSTAELAAAPIRVKQNGVWKKIDLDLEVRDGVVQPKAAPSEVTLSNGGDGPLVTSTVEDVEVSMSWPGALPKPTLDGNVATYPDVFPDVDLRMAVFDSGPSQVLVVKSAEAAGDPRLERIDLAIDVEGGSLDKQASGVIAVRDISDREVGVIAQPAMWDSSGIVSDGDSPPVPAESQAAIDARTEGPADGDVVAPIATQLTADTLSVRPAEEQLQSADTEYPLYLDPEISPTRSEWAMVFKEYGSQKFYKWTDSNGQGVGYQNYSGVSTKRLFWRFKIPSGLGGARIYSSRFETKLVYSYSCTPTTVRAFRTGNISSATTWNNQPGWAQLLDEKQVAGGREGCSPAGKEVDFDSTSAAKYVADNGLTKLTLGLRSQSETNTNSWKRFLHTSVLRIRYSHPPVMPTNAGYVVGGSTKSCSTVQTFGQSPYAQVSANDRNAGEKVQVKWELYEGWEVDPAKALSDNWWSAYKTPPGPFKTNYPLALPKDANDPDRRVKQGKYMWRARARDNSASPGLMGPFTAGCKFIIDWTRPNEPDIEYLPAAGGEPGDPVDWDTTGSAKFKFTPGGTTDVTQYRWSWNSTTPVNTVTAATDKTATVTIAKPSKAGLNTLRVWSYDAAGNPSKSAAVQEFEIIGLQAQSRWTFDEGAGSLAKDVLETAATRTKNITLPDSIAWVLRGPYSEGDGTERNDFKVVFNGAQDGASDSTIVNTRDSFTISAWVDPATADSTQSAVSVDGGDKPAAKLGVQTNCVFADGDSSVTLTSCFAFSVWDQSRGRYVSAYSRSVPDTDQGLIHLIGSYEAGTKQLYLTQYEGSSYASSTWPGEDLVLTENIPTGGRIRVGASLAGSGSANWWDGAVDHVDVARGVPDTDTADKLHTNFIDRQISED